MERVTHSNEVWGGLCPKQGAVGRRKIEDTWTYRWFFCNLRLNGHFSRGLKSLHPTWESEGSDPSVWNLWTGNCRKPERWLKPLVVIETEGWKAIRRERKSSGEEAEELEPFTVSVRPSRWAPIVHNSLAVSEEVKYKSHHVTPNSPSRCTPKRSRNICPHKKTCSIILKGQKIRENPNVHQLMNGKIKCGKSIYKILLDNKERNYWYMLQHGWTL